MPNQIITVESIVRNKLKELGADGLCLGDCGCGVNDLAPCGEIGSECRPAWKSVCPVCEIPLYWPAHSEEPRVCGWCKESDHA